MKGLQFLWRITPFILGLSQNACAYQPGTGSFVAGNLSIAAPYGIPPAEFRTVTKRLTSAATFNITGYNVSVDATPQSAISGWTLTVGITTDVSLVDASSSSNFDVEATTLYIEPPGGKATVDPSWEICAVVFPGLASSVNTSRTVNGSCEAVLSSECIQAVQTGNSGISSNGTCGEYVLPSACRDEFPSASVNSTAITIDQTVLNEERFYAYGSPPTQTSNQTAYLIAFDNIWPVVTLFRHESASSSQASLNTAIQCVQALNGTTTAPSNPSSKAGGPPLPSSTAVSWLLLTMVIFFLC